MSSTPQPIPVTTRDGRTLYAERLGSGSPTVVFEAGMGGSRNTWGAVAPVIAEQTGVVIYDRSGLGRSPADPATRDLTRLRDDLLDLLGTLGDGPFVLVGHSWGGPIIRATAAARPEVVAGLVLVDQTDERCDLFFSKGNERQNKWAPKVLPLTGKLGIIRSLVKKLAKDLPEPWASQMRAEDGTPAAIEAQVAELLHSTDDLRRLRDQPLELPDVPITVISGTQTGFMERGRRPELLVAHRASAAAAPQGRAVNADRSSHYVPFTDAEIVIEEIRRIL